jgi:hypothetical protein
MTACTQLRLAQAGNGRDGEGRKGMPKEVRST